jgi:5-methylcytosine-specific restriction enzyme subunit McrC
MTIRLEAWSEKRVELTPPRAAAVADAGLVKVLLDEPPDRWQLSSDSRIGVLSLDDGLELRVTPRLAIPQLMFLLSYASDPHGWREAGPQYAAEDDLFTAVASAFALHAERALTPAPISGYVTVEDSSTTLRGRLRVAEQVARWPAQPTPLEVVHDDFTVDVPENRLVRGATEALLRMPLLPSLVRPRLLRVRAILEGVTPARAAPTVRAPAITRLNDRYGAVLALAELILRGMSISTHRGGITGVAFVFDMNGVFEDFLSLTLKASLERQGGRVELQRRSTYLDVERRIRLIPDLTWWRSGRCQAVIDSKYKPLTDRRFPNADAYQMLAYCTALDLDRGYLVYAKDAGEQDRNHVVSYAGKVIHVRAIDVERRPAEVLAQVEDLAQSIATAGTSGASAAA